MDTTPAWRATAARSGFARLNGDVEADILVIGGGITGITLAARATRPGTCTRR